MSLPPAAACIALSLQPNVRCTPCSRRRATLSYNEIWRTCRAQGTFASKFDLRAFPVDTQQLKLEAILWDCAQDTIVGYDPVSGKVHICSPRAAASAWPGAHTSTEAKSS